MKYLYNHKHLINSYNELLLDLMYNSLISKLYDRKHINDYLNPVVYIFNYFKSFINNFQKGRLNPNYIYSGSIKTCDFSYIHNRLKNNIIDIDSTITENGPK